MNSPTFRYSVAIRTLGRGGDNYLRLLESLDAQTVPPSKIVVYIAESYSLPPQTIGKEQYVYVKKGMVAQRALPYSEIDTEFILFLDDDLFLPPSAAYDLHQALIENNAQVVAPDVFSNSSRPLFNEILMLLSGRMRARRFDRRYGYKVMRTCGYSYNKNPRPGVLISQTNAGACFMCRKADFLKIRFHDELWMDRMPYAIGDDQVMFFKMHLCGLKQLTLYHSGIEHLDSKSTLAAAPDREKALIEADMFFKTVFFHRFLLPCKPLKWWSRICFGYARWFTLTISILKGRLDILQTKKSGFRKARLFLNSDAYRTIPPIP